jgi:hypothetical protein
MYSTSFVYMQPTSCQPDFTHLNISDQRTPNPTPPLKPLSRIRSSHLKPPHHPPRMPPALYPPCTNTLRAGTYSPPQQQHTYATTLSCPLSSSRDSRSAWCFCDGTVVLCVSPAMWGWRTILFRVLWYVVFFPDGSGVVRTDAVQLMSICITGLIGGGKLVYVVWIVGAD